MVSKCPCLTFSNVMSRCQNLVSKHQLRPRNTHPNRQSHNNKKPDIPQQSLTVSTFHYRKTSLLQFFNRVERVLLENKVHFTNLVICSLYWLLSWRAVNLQMNRTVKYQRALSRIVGLRAIASSSPLPFPFNFFCSRSYFRPITRLETLATQANN